MGRVTMASETARALVDLAAGCRLASLEVFGHELLITEGTDPISWGSYPMAPWAGRLGEGRFQFGGLEHRMPLNLGPHALHGTVFTQAWEREADNSFTTQLRPPWPFAGFVRQRFELTTDHLSISLEVHAENAAMPASCGWHPWFRRRINDVESTIEFEAGFMELRNQAGLPSGRRVPPPPGPWDDCFGDLAGPPVIRWPGVLSLTVESSCDYFVVFNEEPDAFCVEPQTDPPNSLNRTPRVIEPPTPLIATTTWAWEADQ